MQATSGWRVDCQESVRFVPEGGYRERLTFEEVVPLANTRMGEEVAKPFKLMSHDEVANALQQLERIGYPIKTENERIRFTRYPW